MGHRRSALPAARFPVPDVDSAGNQGPGLAARPTRHSVGYFAAVRLRDGKFQFCRETDKFNGATFFEFMKSFRTSIRTGRRVVVITDNAKYHHARLTTQWREEHADDFALDYLPPYSPELNPIERVWKLTRRRCLHNRYFPQLDEVTPQSKRSSPMDRSQRNPAALMRNYLRRCV